MNNLTFNEVNFNPVQQNGQIWLTASELAVALGYKNKQSVSRIYNSNSDEFTDKMTQVIESTDSVLSSKTKGLRAKIRIFSLRGCHLLAMFARTDIAKQFRKWVLDLLDKEVGSPVQVNTLSTTADRKPLVESVNMYCAKTGAIYSDVWKLVHQRFGLESVHGMTIEQVPQAVEYVHSLLLQAQSGSLDLNVAMDNEMWRYVGILKHMELGKALRDAKSAMDNLYKAIGGAQHHSSLIYDAFGEQQMPVSLGDKGGHTAYEKAKAFIARQDEQKKQWLLR